MKIDRVHGMILMIPFKRKAEKSGEPLEDGQMLLIQPTIEILDPTPPDLAIGSEK